MKNISTILSSLALILVIILYFLHFNGNHSAAKAGAPVEKQPTVNTFKIAYFELDSLEANYSFFKEAQTQVKNRENAMNSELSALDKVRQKKISEWQQKGNTMTQAENEQAQREYATMQQNYQARMQALQEELFKQNEDLKSTIKKRIENYLKQYNKDRNYAYIFAYEPNSFMYYQNTAYNITSDLINGLNADYKPAK